MILRHFFQYTNQASRQITVFEAFDQTPAWMAAQQTLLLQLIQPDD
jgi:hypothetical protein